MTWEVDWNHQANTGERVMARNTVSRRHKARQWHLTTTGYLRSCGVATKAYNKLTWEVDWSQRKGRLVLARNPSSKMPSARAWHWVDFHTVQKAGLKWEPRDLRTGRHVSSAGYVKLSRLGMTQTEIALSEKYDLFLGTKRLLVHEHQLVAAIKYDGLPEGFVVRHLNGIKTDNSPDNLILGTTQENTADHDSARLASMYWREQFVIVSALLLNTLRVLADRGWRP